VGTNSLGAWRKSKSGLSAGRVQSVSVRLIVEREREIQNFKAEASYSITAEFSNEAGKVFKAKLPKNFTTKRRRGFPE
jgi:DNA topoisomerase-1